MRKVRRCFAGVLLIILLASPSVLGQGRTGTLHMVGVPPDVQGGTYDAGSGVFTADVSEIADALIRVIFDDMRIEGKQLEWRTKDEHLTFTDAVKLWREDLELEAEWVEYDSAAQLYRQRIRESDHRRCSGLCGRTCLFRGKGRSGVHPECGCGICRWYSERREVPPAGRVQDYAVLWSVPGYLPVKRQLMPSQESFTT